MVTYEYLKEAQLCEAVWGFLMRIQEVLEVYYTY